MTALLFVHDLGDPAGGSRWRPAVDGWPGGGIAPDLPGHGAAPPAVGGKVVPGDLTLYAVRALREAGLAGEPVVAAGHGWGAFAVELLAQAGRAIALVLVDGLGGPWVTPDDLAALQNGWVRAVADDPDVLAEPAGGPDPLYRHGFVSVWERDFTAARRATIRVPVVALESPASPTPRTAREERLAMFGGPTHCEDVDAVGPEAVLAALRQLADSA